MRFSIGGKLVFILTGLLFLSMAALTIFVSIMGSAEARLMAEDHNMTVNQRSAAEVETALKSIRSDTLSLLNILNTLPPAEDRMASRFFFEQKPHIAAILIPGAREFINDRFFLSRELEPALIAAFLETAAPAISRAQTGEALILNGTPVFGVSMLVMLLPGGTGSAALIFFSGESLGAAFGTGANSSYMINDAGDVLVHPDEELVRSGANLQNNPFVHISLESPDQGLQTRYVDEGVRYFGAFQKLTLANIAVITQIPEEVVFEGITAITRRNSYLAAAVFCMSVLFLWFFSKTISAPLKTLIQATTRIENGEFDLALRAKTNDEIGVLTSSFVLMGQRLAERERVAEQRLKDARGNGIVGRILEGELPQEGEAKTATVFFVDICSFTAIMEKLEPHAVMELLNDYITRITQCVHKARGTVDQVTGDAVMAVWGAPYSRSGPAKDALNAVCAALMVRSSLRSFNQGRGGDKKPIIKIGCGISSGQVIAGHIGFDERMEYRVIGDPVTLANRTETLNTSLSTDILITEYTWRLIKDYLITEEMPPMRVKGKERPVRLFAVVNIRVTQAGKKQPYPVTLAGVRELLGLAPPLPPDCNKVAANAKNP
ncbi:MAG: HAMP domain-containing protein [Treponema sp.]|nr:HAMP domain-containing protein [Treponema sp.]